MFKNPSDGAQPKLNLQTMLEQNLINSVFYPDPFLKAGFISKLVHDTKLEVLYLDLDLLYSGYVVSEMLAAEKNVTLFQPTSETLYQMIKEILVKASLSQTIVVVDSLNGLYNILNQKKNLGKTVMSIMMLLASITRMTKSYLVVTSMVRYKKEEGWILSPTGKRLVETKNSKKILLEYGKEGIVLSMPSDSCKLVIPSNLIPLV
ncbi:hypothetical protein DYY66_2310 [Candidatus Nitrosotalea sp. FS]|uniref:hypothetical protein n=1 Tax=Candidatus Nitrosotalea sp. FS TaxID=2341021 RepID=UPI00140C8339|nr:hypothetical protein [Candidatus Nitrosotalea sp. FS]NHH97635.1 hypothetical protein [Candidatus Nitrosotalea sp. FS]